MKLIDITGQTFGRLRVESRIWPNSKHNHPRWRCVCDCGNEKVATSGQLRQGFTSSCGCLLAASRKTHGMTKTRAYRIFKGMKARCENPNNSTFANYGARGIEFRYESFEQFFEELGHPPAGASIDRIDVRGHYEPGNCRWANHKQQGRNTTRNVFLTFAGKSYCLAEWAERIGMDPRTLRARLRRGWDTRRTLTEPVK